MLPRSENDVTFFSRRALEEARAAAAAKSIVVGAAHRHMAAIYAQRLRDEQLIAEGVDDSLSDLQHRDLDEPDASPVVDPDLDDADEAPPG